MTLKPYTLTWMNVKNLHKTVKNLLGIFERFLLVELFPLPVFYCHIYICLILGVMEMQLVSKKNPPVGMNLKQTWFLEGRRHLP